MDPGAPPNQPIRVLLDEDGHRLVQLPSGARVAVPYDPLYEAQRAAAEAAKATDPPDELRCKYKSTRCMNARAKKRNGELHNFCQMHRERANQNQRNSEQRKRNSSSGGKQGAGSTPRARRASAPSPRNNQRSHDPSEDKRTPHFDIPEPLQATDSPHPEPTYGELKETAMLLSFPERDLRDP